MSKAKESRRAELQEMVISRQDEFDRLFFMAVGFGIVPTPGTLMIETILNVEFPDG